MAQTQEVNEAFAQKRTQAVLSALTTGWKQETPEAVQLQGQVLQFWSSVCSDATL